MPKTTFFIYVHQLKTLTLTGQSLRKKVAGNPTDDGEKLPSVPLKRTLFNLILGQL